MSSCGLLVVAFSNAADKGWGSHTSIAFLVTGLSLMVLGLIHCWTTKRNAIIPPRVMRTRTTVVCLICNIIVAMAFLSSVFYIPIFFQGVYGATPFMSAVYMMPFSISISIGTSRSLNPLPLSATLIPPFPPHSHCWPSQLPFQNCPSGLVAWICYRHAWVWSAYQVFQLWGKLAGNSGSSGAYGFGRWLGFDYSVFDCTSCEYVCPARKRIIGLMSS
jgi:hypothetical protein